MPAMTSLGLARGPMRNAAADVRVRGVPGGGATTRRIPGDPMKKSIALAFAALALLVAGITAAGARPATPEGNAFRLGTTGYSAQYCVRLAQRCDQGDQNACKLYNQGCTD